MFFDLGKELPRVSNTDLQTLLKDAEQVFEKAFIPTSRFEAAAAGDTLQVKSKTFKSMRFYETHFVKIVFTKCRFEGCLFLGAHFDECAFHECTFINCNTNKFKLTGTYIDPESFVKNMPDRAKYANVGVDLFHTLLKNSVNESQPQFRDTAEYHFRLWQRFNRTSYWVNSPLPGRLFNLRFFWFWSTNVAYQKVFGYGVRASNILFWTPLLFACVWGFNHSYWMEFGIDSTKLASVSLAAKTAFFTVGNLSTFGTAELTPTTQLGLVAVSIEVVLGIVWIALSTAMVVKRFVR